MEEQEQISPCDFCPDNIPEGRYKFYILQVRGDESNGLGFCEKCWHLLEIATAEMDESRAYQVTVSKDVTGRTCVEVIGDF
jgi:hypothetical protein